MLKEGFMEEVQKLIDKGYKESLIEKKIIGYKELIEHLDGKYSLKEAIDIIKQKTRNYAKRQITWFKKDKTIRWIDVTESKTSKDIAEEIKKRINVK